MVTDIVDILGKIWGEDNDLVSLVEEGFQDDIQCSRRPVGHNDVIHGEFNTCIKG